MMQIYNDWPIWRLKLVFWASFLCPGSTAWHDIAPVLERKTAERKRR